MSFKLYYLICLTLLFQFIICVWELCNPNVLDVNRKFGISPEAFLYNNLKLYMTVNYLKMIEPYVANRPVLKDDYAVFAVRKGKNGNYVGNVCTNGKRELFLIKPQCFWLIVAWLIFYFLFLFLFYSNFYFCFWFCFSETIFYLIEVNLIK